MAPAPSDTEATAQTTDDLHPVKSTLDIALSPSWGACHNAVAADKPAAHLRKQHASDCAERCSRAKRLSCPAEQMLEEAPPPAPQPTEANQAAGIILVREPQPQEGTAGMPPELEVLIGRYEVINALKSKRNEPIAQRYPGEWHFPGGTKRQADRGPLQTACRELCEEFLVGVGAFGSLGAEWGGGGTGPAQLKASAPGCQGSG